MTTDNKDTPAAPMTAEAESRKEGTASRGAKAPKSTAKRTKRRAHTEAEKAKREAQTTGTAGTELPAPEAPTLAKLQQALTKRAAETVQECMHGISETLGRELDLLQNAQAKEEIDQMIRDIPALMKRIPQDIRPAMENFITITGQSGRQADLTRLAMILIFMSGDARALAPVKYSTSFQEKHINALGMANKKHMAHLPEEEENAEVDIIDGVLVYLRNADQGTQCSPVTQRLADLILRDTAARLPHNATLAQIEKARKGVITVRDYMDACGLGSYAKAREQLITGLISLLNYGFYFQRTAIVKKDKKQYRTQRRGSVQVLSSIEYPGSDAHTRSVENIIRNGEVYFAVTPELCKIAAKGRIAPYPDDMYKINLHDNPLSYGFEKYLCIYRNMNLGAPNQNTISVKSLVEHNHTCPQPDTVNNRDQAKLIKDPAMRDLLALKRQNTGGRYGLLDWHFCYKHPKNGQLVPITAEEAAALTFPEWYKLFIWFEPIDYPDQSEALAKIQAGRERRQKQAERRAEKKREELEKLPKLPKLKE